jgi:hypothetical protein
MPNPSYEAGFVSVVLGRSFFEFDLAFKICLYCLSLNRNRRPIDFQFHSVFYYFSSLIIFHLNLLHFTEL